MDSFTVKTGDRREAIQRVLNDSAGGILDLTGCSVKFRMKKKRGSAGAFKVDATAAVVAPAASGVVKYSWAALDVDTPGSYRGYFEVTFGDGTKQSFPNDGWILVNVTP
jgi:hypothetical protein